MPVKGVKVLRGTRQDPLQAALGDGHAGQVGPGLNRFQERVLHGSSDQAPLEFVGEGAGRQGQRLIQWEDAGRTGAGVAHADECHGSEDGGERAGAQSAMGVEHVPVLLVEAQGGSNIAVAAMLQVGLEEQAVHLAAFGLLLRLDLVEGQWESPGGSQPGLEQSELDRCRGSVRRDETCRCHIRTVYLPQEQGHTPPPPRAESGGWNRAWNVTRCTSVNSGGTSNTWSTSAKGPC